MDVLLLQDVRGIGRRHEVKRVSDGHARNFLFPKKLAVPMTPDALKLKEAAEAKEHARIQDLEMQKARLAKEVFEFSLKVSSRGEAFGSVSAAEIEGVLHARGYPDAHLEDRHGIKTTGEHSLPVALARGLKGNVKVIVKASP